VCVSPEVGIESKHRRPLVNERGTRRIVEVANQSGAEQTRLIERNNGEDDTRRTCSNTHQGLGKEMAAELVLAASAG
jgi:hypothetical protein